MKNVGLFLSMVAFISYTAITQVSAQKVSPNNLVGKGSSETVVRKSQDIVVGKNGGSTTAPITHALGEKFGGGIVFDISADAQHGLIAETCDLSQISLTWQEISGTVANSISGWGHSVAGKAFQDWRLPNAQELQKLYLKKTLVGGFVVNLYWNSEHSEFTTPGGCGIDFGNGTLVKYNKNSTQLGRARTIRSF
jgi:hypothetical protein